MIISNIILIIYIYKVYDYENIFKEKNLIYKLKNKYNFFSIELTTAGNFTEHLESENTNLSEAINELLFAQETRVSM
jgi:hypothetical protein